MKQSISTVAILGANGVMGALTGGLLAQHGFNVLFFCRSEEKCGDAVNKAVRLARSQEIRNRITSYHYDQLEDRIGEAEWVIECLSENLDIKRALYARLENAMQPDAIISTMTSSFPLHVLTEGRNGSFKRNFLAVHLFNPPHRLLLCEVAGGAETDEVQVGIITDLLKSRLQRVVVRAQDSPGFIANRVGFLVLSEMSLFAPGMDVRTLDYLFGPYTGRALAPFATMDFIGLDVYRAIIRNLHTYTENSGKYSYELPEYLDAMIENGFLGAKSPEKGGFYRRDSHHNRFVFDIASGGYIPYAPYRLPFIEQVKQTIHDGNYQDAFRLIMNDVSEEADVIRKVLLTYISYSFVCAGHVFNGSDIGSVDLAMSQGFNWLPPSVMLDLLGEKADVIDRMRGYGIHVPEYLREYRQQPDQDRDLMYYRKHIIAR